MNAFPAMAKSIVEVVKLPEPKKPQGGQKPPAGAPPPTATTPPKPAPATTTPPRPPLNPPPKASKELVVFLGTLSLTRAIVFNGLVRELAAKKEKVFVVSAKSSLDTLKWLWGDLNNIEVFGAGSFETMMRMGINLKSAGKEILNLDEKEIAWDRMAYERTGVKFEDRWGKFVVGGYATMTPPAITLPQSPRYALIHDDAEKGWHIRKELLPKGGLKHIRLDKSHPNLFAWQELIANATEIHCVPSAVAVLADSIATKAAKLTLHKYARPQRIDPAMKKNWGVIA